MRGTCHILWITISFFDHRDVLPAHTKKAASWRRHSLPGAMYRSISPPIKASSARDPNNPTEACSPNTVFAGLLLQRLQFSWILFMATNYCLVVISNFNPSSVIFLICQTGAVLGKHRINCVTRNDKPNCSALL